MQNECNTVPDGSQESRFPTDEPKGEKPGHTRAVEL
jgi:hypothetical protein